MPFQTEPAREGIAKRRTGRWQAVYILGADCPCSRKVAKHLAASPRFGDIEEQVALVGAVSREESAALQGAGIRLEHRTAREVRELYGARSAPLLLFVDPAGRIAYSGGFARRNDFRDGFQEARLWRELRLNHTVEALPAFGCALQDGVCSSGF